jgi:O-antigen ligase
MKGLLLTYAFVLSGAVVALRKPVYGLFLYVALSVLRPEAIWGWAGDMQGLSRLVGVPLLIGWAFQGFGSWRFGRARAIVICLLLFTVWSVLSSAQAIDQEPAWAALIEFSKTLLPFLLGVTMIQTEKEAGQMLWVMVLMQAFVCVEMNQAYLTGYNRAFIEGFGGMDNNTFGISLLTTVGAALALFLSAGTWRLKAVAGVSTLLIMHTVLLTFSRGSFVGLLGVALAALAILPKRPKYIGAVVLAGLIAFRLTGPELSARLATTFAPREMRDASAESRFDLWRDCLTIIAEEPVFGLGPQNWPIVAERFGWPPGKEAHSLWVQTTAEVGVPGVVFLLLFYGLTIIRLWPIARGRSPNTDVTSAMVAAGIILAIVGFGISAQFVSVRGLEPPFYVAMAGVVILKVRTQRAPVPTRVTVRRQTVPLTVRPPLVSRRSPVPSSK